MPQLVTCSHCGTLNQVHEDADLSRSRCSECERRLSEPGGRKGGKSPDLARKDVACCFFCDEPARGKRFTFYSGVRKGGSRTELYSATVTVFERWRDLKIYEIHVCRECQLRLWSERPNLAPILWAAGAALVLLLLIPSLILFDGVARLVVGGILGVTALVLGGLAAGLLLRHRAQKPDRSHLDPLVVCSAMHVLPDEGHTFLTLEQYLELVDRGIIDV
jgi:hypothetical protein